MAVGRAFARAKKDVMPNILLIEDNPGDARLFAELLREIEDLSDKYQIFFAERIADALKILSGEDHIDIVVSDMSLPDSRGIDTLLSISSAAPEIPVIFMTGTNDEALAVTAINAGAQDYLMKGKFDAELLSRSLKYATERKKFQNDMRRVLENEEISKQRIKLLDEQKRQLITLNKTKDEFISIASHQLRTPASAVKQYIGMVLQGMAGEVEGRQQELLQKAYDSNDRQLNVINELLKTAQLDSPKPKLNLSKINMHELFDDCVSDLSPAIELKHLLVENLIGTEVTVIGDTQELKLVVTNLIENAVKYTPSYKKVSASSHLTKKYVDIVVTDQGVGITEANQKRIFEKFTRIDNELSDTVKGTGLGLYWAKKIMKLHNGSLRVKSELGKGSSFTMRMMR